MAKNELKNCPSAWDLAKELRQGPKSGFFNAGGGVYMSSFSATSENDPGHFWYLHTLLSTLNNLDAVTGIESMVWHELA